MISLLVAAAIVVGILVRIPVAIAMLLPSLVYIALSPDMGMSAAAQRIASSLNSFPLLAVPLFILAGNLANATGITEKLFDFAEAAFGRVRASLGYVNVMVSFGFSWMSGAAVSDAAVLGAIEVPQMIKRSYQPRFSVGLTAASSVISPIMPPSIPAIIYGVASGASIGAMFVAGVVPAVVILIALCIAVFLYGRKHPEIVTEPDADREVAATAKAAAPIMLAPVIVLGGILSGLFTPTEAAAVTVAYIALIGATIYRTLTMRRLYAVLLSTGKTTGVLMFIVAAASLLGLVLAREQAPQQLADLVLDVLPNALLFLLVLNVVLLLVGMLMEPISAILIVTPVILPVADAFGIDPLHLGIVIILNLMIGLLTPPVGIVLYVLDSVTDVSLSEIMRGTLPFVGLLLVASLLVTLLPFLSVGLPNLLGL